MHLCLHVPSIFVMQPRHLAVIDVAHASFTLTVTVCANSLPYDS